MSDIPKTNEPESTATRREFIRRAGLIAAAAPAAATLLVACGDDKPSQAAGGAAPATGTATEPSAPTGMTPAEHGGTMPTPASTPVAAARSDEMDAMHEKGVKAFPAASKGKGNQLFEPKIVAGVKVYEITARKIQWETEPGKTVEAWAYNDQVPGPQIRVREGDRVRMIVRNELPESTAVHFHGLEVPNDQDGVPFITQPPIKPGQTYTYEFTAPNPGSHMYHSHHNAAKQVGLGLLGAFIIEPKRPRAIEKVDVDYVMVINDGMHGYTLNGKGFPATEPIVARLGQKVRIRFMNEGMMIHPMHLHGMHMTVIDKDGWPQPAPWKCDTLNVAPGERWDVIVNCNNPGVWAFHCHILPHAESEHGMFGMVTALIVNK
ncbi:MAG TPA: copper oxidase [Gemmatimonadaceae bacterium]|nr:copper oxidase [Gemmatimonadaceae bacterium]